MPKTFWYIIARSEDCKKSSILPRTVLGMNLVLFRDDMGKPNVVDDLCPHKKVPLSLGKVQGKNITCRYHGWSFNGAGELKNIPCHGKNEKLMKCKIGSYPVVEQDDWIWVWPSLDVEPSEGPKSYPKHKEYYWFECHNLMEAPIDIILENGLDCSHTGFVHEGLFRSEPIQFVESRIERKSTGVKVETIGEQGSGAKDFKTLLSGGNDITHIDEYFIPHTVKVDYWTGKSHIITYLICTPETKNRTRVYTRMASKFPYFNKTVGRFVEHITKKVIAQDKVILEAQAKNVSLGQRGGFVFSSADAATREFFKAFDYCCQNKELWNGEFKTKKVFYKL